MKRNVWQTLKNACVIFTVIIFAFYMIGMTLEGDMIPSLPVMGMILGFSLILAFINEVFFVKKLPMVIRLLIHFFATAALILVLFAAAGAIKASGPVTLILMFMYAVLYWIGGAITLVVTKKSSKKKNAEKKYEKMFN